MLLIHGFMSSRHQWDLNIERLGLRFRLILIELPGHGNAPATTDSSAFAPSVLLSAIDDARDELGIDQWWVVGQSLGGAVGLKYVLAYPDRAIGLVFTNSRAVFGIAPPPSAGDRPAPRRPTTVDDLRRLPFHPIHAKRFPPDLQQRLVDAADAMPPETIGHLTAGSHDWRSRDELDQLSLPVLLVNGRWESAFQPHVPEAQQSVRNLRVVELEGGHSINIEQPEAFDQAIIDFVLSSSESLH